MSDFRQAIVRQPCRALAAGLTTASLGLPDYERAVAQHAAYVRALETAGLEVTVLPPAEGFPDSVFVEDAALCTPEFALVTRPGAPSRRGEAELVAPVLERFFERVERIVAPGTLDGGDVMMVDRHFYVGLSARTNAEGARQLVALLERHGMGGSVVDVGPLLHLKTGLAYLGDGRLLALAGYAAGPAFQGFEVIEAPREEACAANCIRVNQHVILPAGYPATRSRLAALGLPVIEVDTSEFRKLDGGVSCLSLRF